MSFEAFIEQLSKESRFDRTKLREIYEKKLLVEDKLKYMRFEIEFAEKWESWVKKNGPEEVSEFFLMHGENLIREWLQNFFPFFTSSQRLIIGVKGGGTREDVLFHLFYKFTREELDSIDRSLAAHKITELSRGSAITRVFLESVLALSPIISRALGYKFSLMVEESKFLKKADGRILFLEIVARPQE